MDSRTEKAVRMLVEAVEENDDHLPSYQGKENVKIRDTLMPEVVEKVDLNHHTLRISEGKLKSHIDDALLASKDTEDIIKSFESELKAQEEIIREMEISEFRIAFPLNYHRRSSDLLPGKLRIEDVIFEQVSKTDWKADYVPDFSVLEDVEEMELGSPNYNKKKLREFLSESPNDISPSDFTFWEASYYTRDRHYAVNAVSDAITILLGEMNYAMQYHKTEGTSMRSGPWPSRWSDLRYPFVLLVYDDNLGFVDFYYDAEDGSPRSTEKPHSMYEDAFEQLLEDTPNFNDSEPLDAYLKKGFRAYQQGVTSASEREAFFELWRALEILSQKQDSEKTRSAIERAEVLFDWKNPELKDIRTHRTVRKRNEYVHDGQGVDISQGDKNIVKLLVDGLLDHYMERRSEWDVDQMRFSLEKFSLNEDYITMLKNQREKETEVINWFEEIATDD